MAEQFLKLGDVVERYNVSPTTIYAQIKRGQFPQPVRIGAAVRWRAKTLDEFDDTLPRGVQKDRTAGRKARPKVAA